MINYKEEFKKGEDAAKIRSRKQAILTGLLQGAVIGIALFNDFPLLIKLLIFVILQLILGAVMSSDWMRRKWKSNPKRKNHIDVNGIYVYEGDEYKVEVKDGMISCTNSQGVSIPPAEITMYGQKKT